MVGVVEIVQFLNSYLIRQGYVKYSKTKFVARTWRTRYCFPLTLLVFLLSFMFSLLLYNSTHIFLSFAFFINWFSSEIINFKLLLLFQYRKITLYNVQTISQQHILRPSSSNSIIWKYNIRKCITASRNIMGRHSILLKPHWCIDKVENYISVEFISSGFLRYSMVSVVEVVLFLNSYLIC